MWKTVRLGDVATVIAGQSPKGEHYNKEGAGTPFYQGKKDYGERYLNLPTVWTNAVTKLAEKDDILMSVRAPVGALNIATQKICIGRGLAAIRPTTDVLHEYLFYSLLLKSHQLEGSAGAIFNSINKNQIEAIPVSLPPLAEQQRIIAKLDAAFAEIDRAVELTAKRHINTSSLIAKAQNSLFEDMPLSVPRLNLSEVAKFENGDRGKNYPSKKHQISEGIPFVNAGDFSLDGDITSNGMAYISEERFNLLGAGKFKKDDVLFCLRGSLGKSAINKTLEQGAIASSLVLIRALQEHVQADYLFAFMRSDLVKTYISETAGGAAQPNLSAKVVMGYKIPVPSLEEQEFIADKFWGLRQCGLDAISLIEKKKSELMALKSAILAQELQPHERS